jgi:hypothetical protein
MDRISYVSYVMRKPTARGSGNACEVPNEKRAGGVGREEGHLSRAASPDLGRKLCDFSQVAGAGAMPL